MTAIVIKLFRIDGQWLWDHAVNSPGGSTLQWGADDVCFVYHYLLVWFSSSRNCSVYLQESYSHHLQR